MMDAHAQNEHRWLQQLLGDWTSTSTCNVGADQPAEQSSGTEHVRALGELWIVCEGTTAMPDGGPARMLMTLGYDPAQGAFVGTWAGSMMAHMFVYRGSLDAARRVLTLETEGPSCAGDGGTARYRDVITLLGENERTLTSFALQADGSWAQFMQATYLRKA
ncbi:MAG: DUF1579 domain-containing protein [Giesbergeria sp.]